MFPRARARRASMVLPPPVSDKTPREIGDFHQPQYVEVSSLLQLKILLTCSIQRTSMRGANGSFGEFAHALQSLPITYGADPPGIHPKQQAGLVPLPYLRTHSPVIATLGHRRRTSRPVQRLASARDLSGLQSYLPGADISGVGFHRTFRRASCMGHRLSKIYTRTGDKGVTGLGDGSRVVDPLKLGAVG